MGRRKRFIDRRKATVFRVMHREADSDGGKGEYELVSEEQIAAGLASAQASLPSRHPLAAIFGEYSSEHEVQNDEQRREILELGMPDDGYNYLQHLRAVGARKHMMVLQPVLETIDTDQATTTGSAAQQGERTCFGALSRGSPVFIGRCCRAASILTQPYRMRAQSCGPVSDYEQAFGHTP